MSRPILLRGARQLLTLRGPVGPRRGAELSNLGIIQDGAVLVADGLIRDVGATRRLDNLAESRDAIEINVNGKIVLPGFVDCHTHLVGGLPRLKDSELRPAIAAHDPAAEPGAGYAGIYKVLNDSSLPTLERQAVRLLSESIRQGTTTIESKSGWGITEQNEIKILRTHGSLNKKLGSVVSTFMTAPILLPAFECGVESYIDWVCRQMLAKVRRRKLAEFVDVYVNEELFTVDQIRRVLLCAKHLRFGLKLHCRESHRLSAACSAVELKAVSVENPISLDPAEVAALAHSGTLLTLLPGKAFHQGMNLYPDARTFIDRGVAVTLATGYDPLTSPTTNMQMMICLACRRLAMTPAQALSAATINGACALGRGHRIGSLESGKQADLIVLNVPDYREIPYHFGVNLVEMTIKRGQLVYEASEVKWAGV